LLSDWGGPTNGQIISIQIIIDISGFLRMPV
jgi:hypothetical protein